MSSASGMPGKRPGFFESFRAALTPPELPADDGQPIPAPRTVIVATILAILGGLLLVFIGGVSLVTSGSQLDEAVASYNQQIDECRAEFQGVGGALVAPPESAPQDVKDRAANCQRFEPLTDDIISSARTQNLAISGAIIVIGLLSAVGGWFLRSGTGWSRLMVIGAVIVSVLISLLFQASNLFTMIATFAMIIAVMLCFIGSGNFFFARLKARRSRL